VGSGEEARGLARILNEGRFFKFVHAEVVDPSQFAEKQALEARLRSYVHNHIVTMIIGDMHSEHAPALVPTFYELAFHDERVSFLSLHTLYEQIFHRVPPSLVRDSWMLENISLVPHAFDDALKRLFDITIALILGVLSLPLYPLVYLFMQWDDGGPLFYVAERIGRYNRPLRFKVRSK
jgi:hypothetical protein